MGVIVRDPVDIKGFSLCTSPYDFSQDFVYGNVIFYNSLFYSVFELSQTTKGDIPDTPMYKEGSNSV